MQSMNLSMNLLRTVTWGFIIYKNRYVPHVWWNYISTFGLNWALRMDSVNSCHCFGSLASSISWSKSFTLISRCPIDFKSSMIVVIRFEFDLPLHFAHWLLCLIKYWRVCTTAGVVISIWSILAKQFHLAVKIFSANGFVFVLW